MPKDRIQNCRKYVSGESSFGAQGRREAVEAFYTKCNQFPPTSPLNSLIELPGNQNDKQWRNALRTLMLIEVFFFDNGRSQKVCISQIKTDCGSHTTKSLENMITRQFNKVQRQLNQAAITTLASAATKIRAEYKDSIDKVFLNALKIVFIDSTVNLSMPLCCFVSHKTDQAFRDRLKELGATDCSNPLAFTAGSWEKPGDLALLANYAPLNRGIEFPPNYTEASLIHELLHWCTDPSYEQYTWDTYHGDANHRQIVREATTEWLTRNVTKKWTEGGYQNVYPSIEGWINKKTITVDELKDAYFKGINHKVFADKLVRLYEADVKWSPDQAQLNHLIKTYSVDKKAPDAVKMPPRLKQIVFERLKAHPDRWEDVNPPMSTWTSGDAWKAAVRADLLKRAQELAKG